MKKYCLILMGLWALGNLAGQDSLAFHSRDSKFRSPQGALSLGKTMDLRVFFNPSEVQGVTLVWSLGKGGEKRIPCQTKETGASSGTWTASVTPEESGVMTYWFLIHKKTGDQALGNNSKKVDLGNGVVLTGTGGPGVLTPVKDVVPFRCTVYEKLWTVTRDPGILYYLIPDRFKNGDPKNDPAPGKDWFYGNATVEVHEKWIDGGPWIPGKMKDGHKEDDAFYNNDFYGGDLEGVVKKLDYLQSLGVSQISLTPIFDSPSNHKYEPRDFFKVDGSLGTWDTWNTLVQSAKKRNINLIPMMVYSHLSSDAAQFDRYNRHKSQGAFSGESIRKESPFYDWFTFDPQAQEVNKRFFWKWSEEFVQLTESPGVKDYFYGAKESVTSRWLKSGPGGLRMDVAGLRTADFWKGFRNEIQKTHKALLTLADHRGDLAELFSTGAFNSGTNYAFRKGALGFVLGGTAEEFREILEMVLESTPADVIPGLVNFLSADDTPRAIYDLGYTKPSDSLEQALSRYKLATALQYFVPGRPGVFYGDELGVIGSRDPQHRVTMPWTEDSGSGGNPQTLGLHQALGQWRLDRPEVFTQGDFRVVKAQGSLLVLERWVPGKPRLLGVFNAGGQGIQVQVPGVSGPWKNLQTGAPGDFSSGIALGPWGWAWFEGPSAPKAP